MELLSRHQPNKFKEVLYYTEAELYKLKKKMYPKSTNNLGDGYSQYDESVRLEVLAKVKKMC